MIPTRKEELQEELIADAIREKAHEYNDGAFETWKDLNIKELSEAFLEDSTSEFDEYCKTKWNEENSE